MGRSGPLLGLLGLDIREVGMEPRPSGMLVDLSARGPVPTRLPSPSSPSSGAGNGSTDCGGRQPAQVAVVVQLWCNCRPAPAVPAG
jgi:hypothetical protein